MLKKNYENMFLKIIRIVNEYSSIFFTSHKNVDPDGLASLLVLKKAIDYYSRAPSYIVLPEGMNEVSKKIVSELYLKTVFYDPTLITKCSTLSRDNVYVVVDTSSSEQLGVLKNIIVNSDYIVIDHHAVGDLEKDSLLAVVDSSRKASSEIVYMLTKDLYSYSAIDAMLLLAGIIYDTRRFLIADPLTLWIAGELLRVEGVNYRRVLGMLQTEMNFSERIARLKAAQRLRFVRVDDVIIAYSYVGAFEGSSARALIDLGADIAVVASGNDETRVVARAKPGIVRRLGISLGRDVMVKVGEYLRGGGGGHDAAAAASGRGDPVKALEYTVELIVDLVKKALKK